MPETSFVLDHVFAIVSDLEAAAARLKAAGFDVGFGRDHPGQGTTNRCALFADSFLELLAVRDAQEAAQNPLQLQGPRCPIGIALRGPLPEAVRAGWWCYDPPYGGGQFVIDVHPLSRAHPEVPLLFCMRPAPPPPSGRVGLDPSRLRHPNGASGIVRVLIEGPRPEPSLDAPWLARQTAPAHRLVVEVAGAVLDGPVTVSDALVVRSSRRSGPPAV